MTIGPTAGRFTADPYFPLTNPAAAAPGSSGALLLPRIYTAESKAETLPDGTTIRQRARLTPRVGAAWLVDRLTLTGDTTVESAAARAFAYTVAAGQQPSRQTLVAGTNSGWLDEYCNAVPIVVPDGMELCVEWMTATGSGFARVEVREVSS